MPCPYLKKALFILEGAVEERSSDQIWSKREVDRIRKGSLLNVAVD